MYKKIKLEEFLKISHPAIIDVRESYEFEQGSIPNAINIPVDILLDNYEKYLKVDKEYYIYCESNVRSSRVCQFLTDLGYNVYLIVDGYKGWLAFNNYQ